MVSLPVNGSPGRAIVLAAAFLAIFSAPPALSMEPEGKPSKTLPLKLSVSKEPFVALDEGLGRKTANGLVKAYGVNITIREEEHRGRTRRLVAHGSSEKTAEAFPYFVSLGPKKGVHLIPWAGGEYLCLSAVGAQVRIDGETFHFVDTDMDGSLGKGADGFAGPDSRTLGKLREVLWTAAGRYRCTIGGDPKVQLRLWNHPVSSIGDANILRGWRFLNSQRQRIHSRPVTWDDEMAESCLLHARYSDMNGVSGHTEVEGNAGYSKEGTIAARESVVGQRNSDCREALVEQLDTAFHCSRAIYPGLEKSGIGLSGRHFVMNIIRGRRGIFDRKKDGVRADVAYFWPPHGAERVMTRFNEVGEIPMPVPGAEMEWQNRYGRAVLFHPARGGSYRIELTDGHGAAVRGIHTSPENPVSSNTVAGNFGIVCLLPYKPLASKTRYSAGVYREEKGESRLVFAWSFRTK